MKYQNCPRCGSRNIAVSVHDEIQCLNCNYQWKVECLANDEMNDWEDELEYSDDWENGSEEGIDLENEEP